MVQKNDLSNILTPEFDYNILSNCVKNYSFPRNKIGSLIKSRQITRVKKGFYVKTDENYHKFIVANMIYGPSYVSEDSALSYYGMIPERVEIVTSTSLVRKKNYATPIGIFQFNPTRANCYSFGVGRVQLDDQRAFIIASPEKAIFDRLYRVRGLDSVDAMREYLFSNMRIEDVEKLNLHKIRRLAKLSGKDFVKILLQVLCGESVRDE